MKSMIEVIRGLAFPALVACLVLMSMAQSGAEEVADREEAGTVANNQPTLAFGLERRLFFLPKPDSETSPTLALEQWKQDIGSRGYTEYGLDKESGRHYLLRNSVVEISQEDEGDLVYRESAIYDHDAGYDLFPLGDLKLPVATAPSRSVNSLLSLHPLGFIDPDFLPLRDLLEPFGEGDETDAGFREHVTPSFIYRIWEDPESRLVSEIRQYVREDGSIVRRIAYEDYYRAPSGRIIPRTVIMRTFLKDEEKPVTQLRFHHVLEKPSK